MKTITTTLLVLATLTLGACTGPMGPPGAQGNTGNTGYTGNTGNTGSSGDGNTVIVIPAKP